MLEILQTTRILLMYVRIIYENLYQQDFFDTIVIAHFFASIDRSTVNKLGHNY